MPVAWDLNYDRRVSSEFLDRFRADPVRLLVDIARFAPYPVDLQFRHDPKTAREHASLYVGLTDVLKLDVAPKDGRIRLSAHPTWSETADKPRGERLGFEAAWTTHGISNAEDWERVEDYLERVIPTATKKHAAAEGSVQAAVSTYAHEGIVILDREATLHFRDTATKSRILKEVTDPIVKALEGIEQVKGQPKTKYGGECDLLAIDDKNRLLAIEIKPRNVGTIRWAAAQATVYSHLFERWLATDPTRPDALEILRGQWDQRASLQLSAKRPKSALTARPPVIPIVVIQRGTRPDLIDEFRRVHTRLCDAGVGSPDLELFEAGITGRLVRIPL